MIWKLRQQTRTPLELYIGVLEGFKEEDKEMWALRFPPGFRQRIAPRFLAEIYATGMVAKDWARAWLKEKGIDDCREARVIIPSCASLDAVLLASCCPRPRCTGLRIRGTLLRAIRVGP